MARKHTEVEILASSQSAVKAFQAVQQEAERLAAKMKSASDSSKRSARDTSDAFGGWSDNLGKAAIAAVGVGSALQGVQTIVDAVNVKLQKMIELNERASTKALSFAEAQAQLAYQLPQDSDVSFEEILGMIRQSKIPDKAALTQVVTGAISTGMDTDVSARTRLAIQIAETRPDMMTQGDSEAVGSTIAAIQQLERSVGTDRTGASASTDALYGYIAAGQTASYIKDPQMFAENIAPLHGIMKNILPGQSIQDTMAFASALTTLSADNTGETTRTTAQITASQLKEKLKIYGKYDDSMGLMDLREAARSDPRIRRELLGVMEEGLSDQEVEALRSGNKSALTGDSRGRVRNLEIIRQWYQGVDTPGGLAEKIDIAMEQMPETHADAAAFTRGKQGMVMGTSERRAFELDQSRQRAETRRDLESNAAIRSQLRDLFRSSREMHGYSELDRRLGNLGFDVGSTGMSNEQIIDFQINQAEKQIRRLERPSRTRASSQMAAAPAGVLVGTALAASGFYGTKVPEDNEAREQMIDQLQQMVDELRQIKELGIPVENVERTEPIPAGE